MNSRAYMRLGWRLGRRWLRKVQQEETG